MRKSAFKSSLVLLALAMGHNVYANWTAANTGLTHQSVGSLACAGGTLFAGTEKGLFRSTDEGATWTLATTGMTNTVITALVVGEGRIFAGTQGGVYVSADNGDTWTASSAGLPDKYIGAMTLSGGTLYAASYMKVSKSADNGATWTAANTGISTTSINTLASNGSTIVAGHLGSGVFVSTDAGGTWAQQITGIKSPQVNAVTFYGNKVLAGSDGAYQSADNGAQWTRITTEKQDNVTSFGMAGSSLLAGTPTGMFKSVDGGTTWVTASEGMGSGAVKAFTVCGSNVFAGSVYGTTGIWKRPISELSATVAIRPRPEARPSLASKPVQGRVTFADPGKDGHAYSALGMRLSPLAIP